MALDHLHPSTSALVNTGNLLGFERRNLYPPSHPSKRQTLPITVSPSFGSPRANTLLQVPQIPSLLITGSPGAALAGVGNDAFPSASKRAAVVAADEVPIRVATAHRSPLDFLLWENQYQLQTSASLYTLQLWAWQGAASDRGLLSTARSGASSIRVKAAVTATA